MEQECKPITMLSNQNQLEEVSLPDVVAGFKMLAVDNPEDEISPVTSQRSLRKRKPRNLQVVDLNLNRSLKPRKRTFAEMESEEQIKEYYLDKTVKKYNNSLETIFEEKDDSNQTTCMMSVKRFKRMIQFTPEPTDSKLKKRREKIRKVFGSKINHKRKRKVSMQSLLDKLHGAHSDVSITNSNDFQ
ncbi:uncharacterized protein LOC131672277 isoform X2 [Phymastichus coffea]|uniref:uncharacterized protein LOC131672277 isoform X2 n=1 Tax=Phymastichus coffea TaxID=108790 RepID=UPI00273A7FCA|nr:uncharacterized protein LOC131672277 isoform X2 [Phymastichus coffea]